MRPTLEDGITMDERFPPTLPNEWVNLTQYVFVFLEHFFFFSDLINYNQIPNANKTRDLIHRFYTHQKQLNGGKLNKFYAYTDAALLTTSYVGSYDDLPFQNLASQYTICNRYFQGTLFNFIKNQSSIDCFYKDLIVTLFVTHCNSYLGHFGGSFLSHFWIVANTAPVWPDTKPIPPGIFYLYLWICSYFVSRFLFVA